MRTHSRHTNGDIIGRLIKRIVFGGPYLISQTGSSKAKGNYLTRLLKLGIVVVVLYNIRASLMCLMMLSALYLYRQCLNSGQHFPD